MDGKVTHFAELLDSSEMFCSLKYEDMRGCPYNKFTPKGIATLTVATTFLAILSLFVG